MRKPVNMGGRIERGQPLSRVWRYLTRGTNLGDKGKVSIVGAGPGSVDYLTLGAIKSLQSADAILFDDLVTGEILELGNPKAQFFSVGKRGWKASCRQQDITSLIIDLAKAGKHVVRLKVGDPMIFGRTGEEIEKLEQAGVEVDVVSGITAASAMASEIKMSLTHRKHAHGVKFVTAYGSKGAMPDKNWEAYADGKTTLMIYMGGRMARKLGKTLIMSGMDPATPVIIGEAIAREGQMFHRETLTSLCTLEIITDNPVLIAVGDVFRCSSVLHGTVSKQYAIDAAA